MRIRNILVYVDHGGSNDQRLDSALAIAKAHDATVTGVAVNALQNPSMLSRFGVSGVDEALERARAEALSAIESFGKRAAATGVNAETSIIYCTEGKAADKLARLARVHDLSILRQANPDHDHAATIAELSEQVLLSSGRPVIYIPYVGANHIPFRKALIAWDGSKAATRAVHDALPLLAAMETVLILIVVDPDHLEHEKIDGTGDALARHLDAHGIASEVMHVPKAGISTSSVILNEVSNTGPDLLIMGAYGTPRLREVILGGVTRTVLDSMTVPVFMSH